jgi:hypothetical protein
MGQSHQTIFDLLKFACQGQVAGGWGGDGGLILRSAGKNDTWNLSWSSKKKFWRGTLPTPLRSNSCLHLSVYLSDMNLCHSIRYIEHIFSESILNMYLSESNLFCSFVSLFIIVVLFLVLGQANANVGVLAVKMCCLSLRVR